MTAAILAGGQSRRMGQDKLRLEVSGEALLQRTLRRFSTVFARVLVCTAGPERYPELGALRVYDAYPGAGPMAGLHAALLSAGEPVFLVGGDMPYADPAKALALCAMPGDWDACVLLDAEGRREPLFACYRASVLPVAQSLLESGNYRMNALLGSLRLREVTLAELGEAAGSPLLRNLNNPADYEKLRLELGE